VQTLLLPGCCRIGNPVLGSQIARSAGILLRVASRLKRRSLGSANTFVRSGVPARAFSRSIGISVILMNELDKRM
jgi:hypothetical protein